MNTEQFAEIAGRPTRECVARPFADAWIRIELRGAFGDFNRVPPLGEAEHRVGARLPRRLAHEAREHVARWGELHDARRNGDANGHDHGDRRPAASEWTRVVFDVEHRGETRTQSAATRER